MDSNELCSVVQVCGLAGNLSRSEEMLIVDVRQTLTDTLSLKGQQEESLDF